MLTKRLAPVLAALVLCLISVAAPAQALTLTINGPSTFSVMFGDCVTATWVASTSGPVSVYDWTWNGYQVSSSSTYSRTFCNNQPLGYAYSEDHTVAVWVSGGGFAAYSSLPVHIVFQAGNEYGDCGTQVICEP